MTVDGVTNYRATKMLAFLNKNCFTLFLMRKKTLNFLTSNEFQFMRFLKSILFGSSTENYWVLK